ncbi:MAG: porin family protein [Bacteroidales bacterium]|nr:porin family protein [Bacteroidales bacterium]
MKKQVFVACLVISFCLSTVYSQQKPFVFGFKAGPNIGWMKPDTKGYQGNGIKAGFSWGFIADFFLMENYAIATGFDVIFLNAGLEIPHEIDMDEILSYEGTLHRDYRLKYIQIPVSLLMRTNQLGKFRFFGRIGFGANFLIGAKADDEFISSAYIEKSDDNDIYTDMTFMRAALILGGGAEFNLGGSTSLMAGLTFNNGFTDILKGKNSRYPNLSNKALANFLSLDIGIVF